MEFGEVGFVGDVAKVDLVCIVSVYEEFCLDQAAV